MSAPVALARYLDNEGIITYDEAGTGGNCFTGPLAPKPALAVSIRQYGGSGDIKFALDIPRIQVRVRAAASDEALAKAQEIYEALHGLVFTTMDPGGDAEKYVFECRALDLPSDVGIDENGRPEYVINFEIEHQGDAMRRES
ncbi:MAG: hypothetical protein IBX61_09230 [Thermoleophilia bacterium]|nr:hypothetical protein [Thermoleophilia bacterium]